MTENRLLRALRLIVEDVMERVLYHVPIRYRVVESVPGGLALQIVKTGTGLPDMIPIGIMPGAAGVSSSLTLGSTVLVQFIEGDPALPIVTHFDRTDAPGFLPVTSTLDATGTVTIGGTAGQVNVAANGSEVQLSSGSDTVPTGVSDPTGRVVRYGDPILFGSPGPGVVTHTGTGIVSRVDAL